jgi:cytoskeletal protein CcmA (bactofilin family)
MFKDNKEINNKDAETIIGPSIIVKGNFHGEGNMIIEGSVEGSVKTNSFLLIGKRAKITASVEANEAKIGGEVNGNVKISSYLEIASTAKIFGDIECSELSVERGAIIGGKCTVSSGEKIKSVSATE